MDPATDISEYAIAALKISDGDQTDTGQLGCSPPCHVYEPCQRLQ